MQVPTPSDLWVCRGNHETPGVWKMGAFDEDVRDLEVIAGYLKDKLEYKISLLVGHSRGSVVGLRWMTLHGKEVEGYINVSGRYRMEVWRFFC